MTEDKMIQHLQERFGLSKVQASVIYFQLQKHFENEKKMAKNSTESLEIT
jgi:hypothetical protein